MRVIAELFRDLAVEQQEKVSDSKSQKYSVWVSVALFCEVVYISVAQNLEEDKEERENRGIYARKRNVQFRAARTFSRGDFKKHKLILKVAFRNVKVEEELTVKYGVKISF